MLKLDRNVTILTSSRHIRLGHLLKTFSFDLCKRVLLIWCPYMIMSPLHSLYVEKLAISCHFLLMLAWGRGGLLSLCLRTET